MEIWKDVPGYEGLYQVSNLGRVKSLARKVWNGRIYYTKKGRIRKVHDNGRGHLAVVLYVNSKVKSYQVHQLSAMAFLNHTPCGYKIQVDHINKNSYDNRLENLQLLTSREHVIKDSKRGQSKLLGAHKNSNGRGKAWKSAIQINGKSVHLGYFDTPLEAHRAYMLEIKKLV